MKYYDSMYKIQSSHDWLLGTALTKMSTYLTIKLTPITQQVNVTSRGETKRGLTEA